MASLQRFHVEGPTYGWQMLSPGSLCAHCEYTRSCEQAWEQRRFCLVFKLQQKEER